MLELHYQNYFNFEVVDHEDDEPSILATKSFLPTPPTTVPSNILSTPPPTTVTTNNLPTPPKTLPTVNTIITSQPQKHLNGHETGTGYSHLEWSSSIPYNVAEEPDDVQGKYD